MQKEAIHIVDPVTRLPHYISMLPELERLLREDSALGMILIGFNGLDRIEEAHGPKIFDKLVREICSTLIDTCGVVIREDDRIAAADLGGTTFMIFLSEKRKDRQTARLGKHDVEIVADRIQEHVFPQLFSLLYPYTKERPKMTMGYSFVVHNPLIRVRRLIYRLIDQAKEMSCLQNPRTEVKSKERLQRIILEENVSTVFQPILELDTGKVMGYEALTRGPAGTVFEPPLLLFSLAKDNGLVFELDRLCRRKSLSAAAFLPSDTKIFINTLPTTIHDPEFRGKFLHSFLKDIEKKPSNIVFEITERAAIENFVSFREAMRYYTDIGMWIAIDDTGTGYSTLEAIVELNPHYLKFDLSMVKGIGQSVVKQEMLGMLSELAARINAVIIAEGIEDKEDLQMLKKMGIKLGQGFYFSKPLTVEEITRSNSQVVAIGGRKRSR